MLRKTVLAALACLWALTAQAGEVRLFAAASLGDAMRALCADYEQRQPKVACVTNFAGTGTLAKQLLAGAPADLFVAANPDWMARLSAAGRVEAATRRQLAGNALVFVGRAGTKIARLADLPGVKRIALGSPDSVPAGDYARTALTAAGLYDRLSAAGSLVFAQDVRQALVYAERGLVDGAFVYRTDARLAKLSEVLFTVPATLYPPVRYPMALTSAGVANPQAVAFHRYLQGEAAGRILESFGFSLP